MICSHEVQQRAGRPKGILFRYPAKELYEAPRGDVNLTVKTILYTRSRWKKKRGISRSTDVQTAWSAYRGVSPVGFHRTKAREVILFDY